MAWSRLWDRGCLHLNSWGLGKTLLAYSPSSLDKGDFYLPNSLAKGWTKHLAQCQTVPCISQSFSKFVSVCPCIVDQGACLFHRPSPGILCCSGESAGRGGRGRDSAKSWSQVSHHNIPIRSHVPRMSLTRFSPQRKQASWWEKHSQHTQVPALRQRGETIRIQDTGMGQGRAEAGPLTLPFWWAYPIQLHAGLGTRPVSYAPKLGEWKARELWERMGIACTLTSNPVVPSFVSLVPMLRTVLRNDTLGMKSQWGGWSQGTPQSPSTCLEECSELVSVNALLWTSCCGLRRVGVRDVANMHSCGQLKIVWGETAA